MCSMATESCHSMAQLSAAATDTVTNSCEPGYDYHATYDSKCRNRHMYFSAELSTREVEKLIY